MDKIVIFVNRTWDDGISSKYTLYISISWSSDIFCSPGDSRVFGPFCQTAKYNRSIVRIKELQFERKKDISREVMKEMKLMRDLRHDNVNSFIGACVEMSADLHRYEKHIIIATFTLL